MKDIILFGCFVLLLKAVSCANYSDELLKEISKPEFRIALSNRAVTIWNWAKDQSKSEDNFVGRCFGIAKKLRFIIPVVVFALGVIITTLKFLTLFSLKGLAISMLLVVMNVAGWAAKIGSWKSQWEHHGAHHPPQNVHFHIHKDNDHYNVGHTGPTGGWNDRIADGLSKTTSLAEKIELLNLYKRLGLNVDQLVSPQFR
ncbi:hypothetical protein AMK59_22 [Oryctes borbonicus]|uniref:Uncharacterized protein n=1 Tax=Oryctes borbonicus TaxID=1629725 RepID=A0A0T6BBM7_9SCAR|nr:hypothetical protein AMK59_22 [Oryctes borbonicus]